MTAENVPLRDRVDGAGRQMWRLVGD